MQIIRGAYPPNMDQIDAAFNSKKLQGILYAYGMSIFNPSSVDIPPWLVAHEAVHGYRQMYPDLTGMSEPVAARYKAMSAEEKVRMWWQRYIESKEFRFAEELVAHAAEYRYFYRQHPNDRRYRRLYLTACAERLAGPLYGKLLTVEKAKQQIKKMALDSEGKGRDAPLSTERESDD